MARVSGDDPLAAHVLVYFNGQDVTHNCIRAVSGPLQLGYVDLLTRRRGRPTGSTRRYGQVRIAAKPGTPEAVRGVMRKVGVLDE